EGNRVAYGSCRHAFVWTPSRGSVIQADPVASLACHLDQNQCCSHIYSIALADDRLAYAEFSGLSSKTIWLGGTTLTSPPHRFVLDQGGNELFANGELPP